ncbi:MAG: hypothetical protein R2877_06400 [Bdellovibrionota bacterium]
MFASSSKNQVDPRGICIQQLFLDFRKQWIGYPVVDLSVHEAVKEVVTRQYDYILPPVEEIKKLMR